MKFKFTYVILALAAFVFVSCNKNEGPAANGDGGSLTINFALPQAAETKVAYTVSTSKPTTSWSQNIKSLTLFLTNSAGVIQYVHSVTIPTTNDMAQVTSETFTGIPASTFPHYTAYLIANYDQAGVYTTWGAAPLATRGSNINTLLMSMATTPTGTWTDKAASEAATVAYNPAGEIFLATQTGVEVVANDTKTHSGVFALTRAVSMFRTRLNPTTTNATVNFDNADASLRIRIASTGINPTGVSAVNANHMIYSKGFSKVAPVAPYSPTTLASILDQPNGQTHWKDIMIYPGGHATASTSQFDIVVSGMAPVGYIPLNTTTPLTSATLVYWSGKVQADIAANGILEVNLTLNSKGTPIVPPVSQVGNLIINLNLQPWGNIKQAAELPI